MKYLYLIRHGEAESKGSRTDFDRNLVNAGREEVALTAREMVKKNINPALILSSPANRALQTATIVAETIGYSPEKIVLESDIYYTDAKALIDILKSQNDEYGSILLAGHNPSISQLADILTNKYNDIIPTGGLVAFEIDSGTWNNFEKKEIKHLFNLYP